jgi:cytochrome c-type biogenesis protein CcmH/NrfG
MLRPTTSAFYAPLANLYLEHDYPEQAEAVVTLGLSYVADTDSNKVGLWLILATIMQIRNDSAGLVRALEQASSLDGGNAPEIQYNLGQAYLAQGNKPQGIQLLRQFASRICKGPKSDKFRNQCEQTSVALMQNGAVR